MAEDKKHESHKPSDKKHEEHKGEHKPAHKAPEHKAAEHKHEEHKGEHKPAHKAPEHKAAEHKHEEKAHAKGAPERSEKPVGKSDLPTGAHKKTEAAEKREAGKTGAKTRPQKGQKPAPKTEDVKIVDTPTEKKHVARAKANLTDEQRKALSLRENIAGRRPWFRRTQWYEYKRLSDTGWRRPRGVDSAMRRHFGYEQPVVRVGFAGPKSVRGLHASGFQEVYVEVLSDLDKIDKKTQAARVSGTLGTRKLRALYEAADKLGVRILNRRTLAPAPKATKSAAPATTDKGATTAKPTTPAKGGENQ